MSHSKLIFLFIISILPACYPLQEDQVENDKAKEENINIFTKELKDYPKVIQEIVISEDGILRGLNFGLSEKEIRGIENVHFAQSTEDKHFLLAEIELSDDVNLDVEYHFNENKLYQLNLIVYTTGVSQQEKIYTELHEFLSKKFQVSPTKSDWNIDHSLQLIIRKVGNQQEADIELVFKQL